MQHTVSRGGVSLWHGRSLKNDVAAAAAAAAARAAAAAAAAAE